MCRGRGVMILGIMGCSSAAIRLMPLPPQQRLEHLIDPRRMQLVDANKGMLVRLHL